MKLEELIYDKQLLLDESQKYKSIEEKLGINLITLFKMLEKGFYYVQNFHNIKTGKWERLIKYTDYCYLYYDGDCRDGAGAYFVATIDHQFYISDYGKTWALTKEELEN